MNRGGFFLAPAQILFMLGLLRPALGRAKGLHLQPLGRRGVSLRVQRRQLFDDGLGKADVRYGRHGAAGAAQGTAQLVLVKGHRQAQARPGLAEGHGPAHRPGGGVLGHQDDPGVLGPGGGAHRLLADGHLTGLFGQADHG